MVREPFVGNGRRNEGGALVTRKQDFNAHVEGGGFYHNAESIRMNPAITTLNGIFGGADVQDTLEKITTYISSAGQGFITIGDGYDDGDFTVGDEATPTLSSAFAAAFNHERLANGGIVLVKAGKYFLRSTVNVPAGISIMGEIGGTIIIGEMTETSMFKVLRGDNRATIGGDSGSGQVVLSQGAPLDHTRFFNLTLIDNLDGYVAIGANPIATMQTVPMIQCEISSHVTFEEVRFAGRLNQGVVSGRGKTLEAIGYVTGGGDPTTLTVDSCYFDGMKIGIDFSPNNGNIDFLTVRNCRARTFGTEDAGQINKTDNCFVKMSLCNANLSNNYHVGASTSVTTVNSCFVVGSAGGSTDVRMIITGNSGGPNVTSGTNNNNLFYDNTSTTSIKTVKAANNWGASFNNDWFVVVGNGTVASGTPSGDFVGSGAIDAVLSLVGSGGCGTTIIVNPGTYNITSSGSSAVKYIGNKKSGDEYPVFNLNTSTSGTASYRQFQTGPSIRGIKFICSTATTINYHYINPAHGNNGDVIVEDCIFEDCALIPNAITSGVLANDERVYITVKNCYFFQTGDYTGKISLLLPPANIVTLDSCIFRQFGYIGGIGSASDISYSHTTQGNQNFIIRNCIMDATDGTITVASALTDHLSYFFIDDATANVFFENCEIYADDELDSTSVVQPIHSGLTSVGAFKHWLHIKARSISFNNCTIKGPDQTFSILFGGTYAMATIFAEPAQSFKFTNSRILGGALPLQISGITAFSTALTRDAIQILNSEIVGAPHYQYTSTLVDIDFDVSSFTVASTIVPLVRIAGNTFRTEIASDMTQVRHLNADGAWYDAQGVVQVYAPGFDVNISDNKMFANLRQYSTLGNPYNDYTGIYVNNYDATAAAANETPRFAILHDNIIEIENYFENASASSSASCIFVRNSFPNIHHNTLVMNNTANGVSGNFAGCLYVDCEASSDTASGDALVTGNIFSRRDQAGDTSTLKRGYVLITSGSRRGMLTNNSFCSAGYSGASTVVVEDNSTTTNKWVVAYNKNQTETISAKGYVGNFSMGLNGTTLKTVVGSAIPGVTDSRIDILESATIPVTFDYEDLNIDETFLWRIPIYGLVPHGAYLTTVTTYLENSTNTGVTRTGTLTLRNTSGNDGGDTGTVGTAGLTLTRTPAANTYKSVPEASTVIELVVRINSSVTLSVTSTPISITYRW